MTAAMHTPNGMVQIVPGRNERGEHVFSVLVKRSYRIVPAQPAQRCDADAAFRLTDEYYDHGDPEWSTVQHEGELAPYKPMTDVVVIGRAHAPAGTPVQQMVVGVAVGERRKSLAVIGDRVCHFREGKAPSFSDPQPFTDMEIRYDRAYGGHDERSDPAVPFHYPRNAMGKGVVLRNLKDVVQGRSLPNIEDPADLLSPERVVIDDPQRWHLQPVPQGLGWRQRTWYPRSALLGSYPPFLSVGTVTAEERGGVLPANHVALAKQGKLPPFEAHFSNGASLDMIFRSLRGDEPIHLMGLTPPGDLQFHLPGDTPAVGLDLGFGMQPLQPRLHTVSIRPDDLALDLVWQAAQTYPGHGWLPQMKRLQAEVH